MSESDPEQRLLNRLSGGGTNSGLHDTPGGIPPETFRKASDDVITWCEELTPIDGNKMDFSGVWKFWADPLKDVVAEDAPKQHIWKFARGLGKTEQSARAKWYVATTDQLVDCIYSTPRMRQIRTFQKTVVRRMIHGSRGDPPILMDLLDSHDVRVQRNDLKAGGNGPGSVLEARSAWNDGNQLQGYRGQFGIADEVQQWTRPAIENFKNAVDKGLGRVLFTGTPDFEGTVYSDYWKESDQREWYFRCPHDGCDTEQTVSLSSIQLVDTDPKTWERVCLGCGEVVDKSHILTNGFWKATNPDGIHRGYHLSQLVSPRHELDYVMRERERPTTPESDFVKYRLGEFYSGAAKPIPEQAVQMVSDETRSIRRVALDDQPHFVGVDFGGGESSDTVVCVIHEVERQEGWPTKISVDTVAKIDADTRTDERRQIAELIARFRVPDRGRCVMDMGYGSEQVDLFQNGDHNPNDIPTHGWGSTVLGHRMGSVGREQRQWPYMTLGTDKVLKAYKPPWANRVIRLFPDVQGYDDVSHGEDVDYDVSRSADAGISIPYADDPETREIMDYWTSHLTAIKREYKESNESGKKKEFFTTFGTTQKDDGFMALLYAYTAAVVGPTSSGGDSSLVNIGGRVG